MRKKKFEPIDLVIVNFYPFEKAIKKLLTKTKLLKISI